LAVRQLLTDVAFSVALVAMVLLLILAPAAATFALARWMRNHQ
jgi:hypothetical protein